MHAENISSHFFTDSKLADEIVRIWWLKRHYYEGWRSELKHVYHVRLNGLYRHYVVRSLFHGHSPPMRWNREPFVSIICMIEKRRGNSSYFTAGVIYKARRMLVSSIKAMAPISRNDHWRENMSRISEDIYSVTSSSPRVDAMWLDESTSLCMNTTPPHADTIAAARVCKEKADAWSRNIGIIDWK